MLEPVTEITKSNACYILLYHRTRVTLKESGIPPPTKVNNLILGRTWVDSPGEMVLTNLTTGDKVLLYFQPCGSFGYGIDHQFLVSFVVE